MTRAVIVHPCDPECKGHPLRLQYVSQQRASFTSHARAPIPTTPFRHPGFNSRRLRSQHLSQRSAASSRLPIPLFYGASQSIHISNPSTTSLIESGNAASLTVRISPTYTPAVLQPCYGRRTKPTNLPFHRHHPTISQYGLPFTWATKAPLTNNPPISTTRTFNTGAMIFRPKCRSESLGNICASSAHSRLIIMRPSKLSDCEVETWTPVSEQTTLHSECPLYSLTRPASRSSTQECQRHLMLAAKS